MFERILARIREKIRRRHYVVTFHARREMNEDGLTIYDVEHVILSGKILERQRDLDTLEPKYRIQGLSVAGRNAEVVVKISPTGSLVVITVYLGGESEREDGV